MAMPPRESWRHQGGSRRRVTVYRRQVGRGEGGAAGLRLDAVFHAVALAFDDDDLGMVYDAVEQRAGQAAVVVEDGGPVLERPVSGEDDGAAFVAFADDLEQQFGAAFVDGQMAQLVDHQ